MTGTELTHNGQDCSKMNRDKSYEALLRNTSSESIEKYFKALKPTKNDQSDISLNARYFLVSPYINLQ